MHFTSLVALLTAGGLAAAETFKSTFTYYGSGDTYGSGNCQTNTAACHFFTSPGYSAAVSENLYGVGPGQNEGPACHTCWKISGETTDAGQPIPGGGKTIVVKLNNLCPKAGNPICSMNSLSDTNQYNANINIDLCMDSGAKDAFYPPDPNIGVLIGTAERLPDCSGWSGQEVF